MSQSLIIEIIESVIEKIRERITNMKFPENRDDFLVFMEELDELMKKRDHYLVLKNPLQTTSWKGKVKNLKPIVFI